MENKKILEKGDNYQYNFSFTQDQVIGFAEISGDKNPIHLDSNFASNTIFKKPIIHGFLSGSVFSKVFGTLFPGLGTIYLKQSMIFLKPMYVEEKYTAVFEVTEVNNEKHKATISTKIFNANNEETISGEAIVLNAERI